MFVSGFFCVGKIRTEKKLLPRLQQKQKEAANCHYVYIMQDINIDILICIGLSTKENIKFYWGNHIPHH